jgi:hypothetical protein
MNDFSRFPGAPEIGTDDEGGGIELAIHTHRLDHLQLPCLTQAILRYTILRMADDNPLLICKAIAMTNREVSIVQALATKQVVQQKIPGSMHIPGGLKKRCIITGS